MPYCGNCGSKLDSSDKFCPNCSSSVMQEEHIESIETNKALVENNVSAVNDNQSVKPIASVPSPKKKSVLPLIITLSAVGLALLGGGIFAVVKLASINKKPDNDEAGYVDAEKYFEENADIKSITPAKKSKNRVSEKEVSADLKERGFTTYPITSEYSDDGSLIEKIEVSESSATTHPVYETYYISSNNEKWIISVIDGNIIAFPSNYNMKHDDKAAVVISETKEVVSYDIATNTFFRTIPNESTMKIRVLDRIDAKTLDSIDLEG